MANPGKPLFYQPPVFENPLSACPSWEVSRRSKACPLWPCRPVSGNVGFMLRKIFLAVPRGLVALEYGPGLGIVNDF